MAFVLAGAPTIRPGPAVVDAVGVDQGSTYQQVLVVGLQRVPDHVSEVGGLSGDDVEGLVQVAVGGGQADAVVVGQVEDCGALTSEAQQTHDLVALGGGPATGALPAACLHDNTHRTNPRRPLGRAGCARVDAP
ncbi:hypothetical protein [Kineococcus arenarius]|uniref:hypothetical protein n=1 Tax=unclassified Kineococcus TaxID=2621656 RepID=UPI003D7DF37E